MKPNKCKDCCRTWDNDYKYFEYEVHPWVETEFKNNHKDIVCITCLNKRMAYEMKSNAFTDSPINFKWSLEYGWTNLSQKIVDSMDNKINSLESRIEEVYRDLSDPHRFMRD